MIFITLGSQKFPFNRLLKKMDEMVENGFNEVIFSQIGNSSYKPKYYSFKDFLDKKEYMSFIQNADIIITHGGTGAIVNAIKKKKKVIAVPRLAEYGEHVDNHQLQIVEQFKKLNLIYACEDLDLTKAIKIVRETEYSEYISNTNKIIENIDRFINQ